MNMTIGEEGKSVRVIMILFVFLLLCGTAAGSVYLMRRSGTYNGLSEYLTSYLKTDLAEMDKTVIFKNSLKSNLIILGLVFAAGFFKIGFLLTGACLIKRGFVIGFTVASFIEAFGWKGAVIALSYMPSLMLIIPAFVTFCSISAVISFEKYRINKKIIFSYIFFAIFIFTKIPITKNAIPANIFTTGIIHPISINKNKGLMPAI